MSTFAKESLKPTDPATSEVPGQPKSTGVDKQAKRQLGAAYRKLPLSFEANQGQADSSIKFISSGIGYKLYLASTEAIFSLSKNSSPPDIQSSQDLNNNQKALAHKPRAALLRMKLEGADAKAEATGLGESPCKVNYLLGNHLEQWRAKVPVYERVQYRNVYPGIDVIYYGNQSQFEYDFVVAPGANYRLIKLSFEGASELRLDARGNLLLGIGAQQLKLTKPLLYQIVDGQRKRVDGRYRLEGRRRVSFSASAYNPALPLVIDPVFVYSTYLGGESLDEGQAIAVDAAGNAYVTGWTWSTTFPPAGAPAPTPARSSIGGVYDAFVFKLSADGSTLLYRTYLGGRNIEYGLGIAVDNAGNAYITGWTSSGDFPVVNALQTTYAGGGYYDFARFNADAFVTKLSADGSRILYSSYLGGSAGEYGSAIAADNSGNAFVTGMTVSSGRYGSTGFHTTPGAFRTTYSIAAYERGDSEAFVTKLNTNMAGRASLVYSTYLGGNGTDVGTGIAIDASGSAYVVGTTNSANFPTASPAQPALGGGRCMVGSYRTECSDIFVTRLSADGSRLLYSTYLGGMGTDKAAGIAVSSTDNAYLTGETSGSFPTFNPYQPAFRGGQSDVFVARLDDAGRLVFSTYLGGRETDRATSIAVDNSQNIYLTGSTTSEDFPRQSPLQLRFAGRGSCDVGTPGRWHPCTDAFVAKMNATGRDLLYSTFLGGGGDDEGRGIAVDRAGNAYVTGMSSSPGANSFPTANPLQFTLSGGDDVIVLKLSDGGAPPAPANLIATAIEVTQAVQDLNNSVRLVAGKRTFVRFYVRSTSGSLPTTARLRAQRGLATITLNPLNPGGFILVRPAPQREILNHAFLFELPSSLISPGSLTLTAEVNPINAAGQRNPQQETSFTDNTIQQAVGFQQTASFNLMNISVGYTSGGADIFPADSHLDKLESWLRRAYPLSELQVWRGRLGYIFGFAGLPGCGMLDAQLYAAWIWDHSLPGLLPLDIRYYGMVDDRGGFMRGCSFPGVVGSGPTGNPASQGFTWDTDGSYGDWYGGHELGHAYGRWHIMGGGSSAGGCGTEGWPVNTIYPSGRISPVLSGNNALFGFDSNTRAVLPPTSSDVMSYCSNQWISDFTYHGLFPPSIGRKLSADSYPLLASARPLSLKPFSEESKTTTESDLFIEPQCNRERLLISGVIDGASSKATLLPAFVVPNAHGLKHRVLGNYAIVLRDIKGDELARHSFTPMKLEGGAPTPRQQPDRSVEGYLITELVPYVASATQVDIEAGGKVIGSLKAGPAAPRVEILSPKGGETSDGKSIDVSWKASDKDDDPLTFTVLYSPDKGASWRMLASYLTGRSIKLDATNITGSKEARLRVVVSDGLHTTFADTDKLFTVVSRPPLVKITSPDKNLIAVVGQTVTFEVTAFKEGASLPSQQLNWTSSINGPLGNGSRLSISNLTPGQHRITVNAEDRGSVMASDSIAVTVVADWSKLPPVPDVLTAGPPSITFNPAAGEVKALVSLDNENNIPFEGQVGLNSLSWTATTNVPWLILSATKGNTPDQITVEFKDTGLTEGTHTADITFVNPAAPEQRSIIRVQVTLGPGEEYIPGSY